VSRRAPTIALLALAACSSGTAVRYTGKELAPAVAGDAVSVFSGAEADGYEILGVVTARCETLNGSSGLFDTPCSEEALVAACRARAAEAGGTAIAEPSCRQVETSRETTQQDAGTVTTDVREALTCQATVLRARAGAVAVLRTAAVARGRKIDVDGSAIVVDFAADANAPPHAARRLEDVGEMNAFPAGYAKLGRVSAECPAGCSPSAARRALRIEAARAGALAVAEAECDALGEGWRCTALAVGEAAAKATPDTVDAGVATDAGGL
jgi:hypothetical protein